MVERFTKERRECAPKEADQDGQVWEKSEIVG
jgi:hypothetical protein